MKRWIVEGITSITPVRYGKVCVTLRCGQEDIEIVLSSDAVDSLEEGLRRTWWKSMQAEISFVPTLDKVALKSKER